ncbi:MAG: hypothetical protein KAU31_03995, partial [Spirochaetaceae bacterium]|nr:hypothetical protein [Spirochaetaceae bacterium]
MQSYTPYGFLQNPAYQCVSDYSDVQSGVLKSDDQIVGFGWVVPSPKIPEFIISVGVGVTTDKVSYLIRDDFRPMEVSSNVHTPFRFGYTIGPAP